jgi:hypothetical protein
MWYYKGKYKWGHGVLSIGPKKLGYQVFKYATTERKFKPFRI